MKRASKNKNSLPLKNTAHTPSTKRRILEVSDEEAVREMIAAICKSRGFDVIQARCGDEDLVVEISEESLRAWLDENPDVRKQEAKAG